jgi:hypothetical protein
LDDGKQTLRHTSEFPIVQNKNDSIQPNILVLAPVSPSLPPLQFRGRVTEVWGRCLILDHMNYD